VTSANPRAQQIAAFYAHCADRVRKAVAANVVAPEETIDDACQTAWTILMRRADITLNERGISWLATVAIREAWRLNRAARELPVGTFQGDSRGHDDSDMPEPADTLTAGTEEQALARLQHAERIADLQTLKLRERRDLYLFAIGYRYSEIAQATSSTYTAVDRRLKEGRSRLRRLARERDEAQRAEGDKPPSG
jgi:DNA-directed RNA polymerase specialized sigma24 family protein